MEAIGAVTVAAAGVAVAVGLVVVVLSVPDIRRYLKMRSM